MPRRGGVHVGQTTDLSTLDQKRNPNWSSTSLNIRRESKNRHRNMRRRGGAAGNSQCKAETRKATKVHHPLLPLRLPNRQVNRLVGYILRTARPRPRLSGVWEIGRQYAREDGLGNQRPPASMPPNGS